MTREPGKFQDDEARWSSWMAKAQQGNGAAYEKLLTEIGSVIESYLVVRFGKLAALEDFVQECLLAVHSARRTYNPERAFRPWMFTVVRHRTIDLLRRSNRWVHDTVKLDKEYACHLDADHLTRLIDGVKILESLKPEQREAVVLTKYAGMTTAEAASWLEISESSVKARLRRGLKAANQQLTEEEPVT